jgi:hypothetical protein
MDIGWRYFGMLHRVCSLRGDELFSRVTDLPNIRYEFIIGGSFLRRKHPCHELKDAGVWLAQLLVQHVNIILRNLAATRCE